MTSRAMKAPKRFAIPSEAQEQRWLVKWLKSHHLLQRFVVKTNNEGKRTEIQGRNLKLMGLHPGASDLFIAYPNRSRTKAGLWLEVKRNMHYPPSARKSETWIAEEEFIADMRTVGFAGEMCYGWIDGKRIVEEYLLT